MPPDHHSSPVTFEADDIIVMEGSPDWDGGCALARCFGRGFTEADERLMNGRNQHRELIGRDLVATYICSDDIVVCSLSSVGNGDSSGTLFLRVEMTKYHAGANRDDDLGSP
jgi:hypothetical protein